MAKKYDLIFIPFNSIHHLYNNEDLFKALNVVKNHLKDGGSFLLDCFIQNIQYIVEGEIEKKEIAAYTNSDAGKMFSGAIQYDHFKLIQGINYPMEQTLFTFKMKKNKKKLRHIQPVMEEKY